MGVIRIEPVGGINRDTFHFSRCWARAHSVRHLEARGGWGGSAPGPLGLPRTTAAVHAGLPAPAPWSRVLLLFLCHLRPRCPREHLCVQQAELDYLSGRHKDTHRNSRLVRPSPPLPSGQPWPRCRDGPSLTPCLHRGRDAPELRGLRTGLASHRDEFNLRGWWEAPPPPPARGSSHIWGPSPLLSGSSSNCGAGGCAEAPVVALGHLGALRSGGLGDAKELGQASNLGSVTGPLTLSLVSPVCVPTASSSVVVFRSPRGLCL